MKQPINTAEQLLLDDPEDIIQSLMDGYKMTAQQMLDEIANQMDQSDCRLYARTPEDVLGELMLWEHLNSWLVDHQWNPLEMGVETLVEIARGTYSDEDEDCEDYDEDDEDVIESEANLT